MSPIRLVLRIVTRLLLAVIVCTAPLWATASTREPNGFSGRLSRAVAAVSFDTVDWQIAAIVGGIGERLGLPFADHVSSPPPPDSDVAIALVERYFALGVEQRSLQSELDAAWSRRDAPQRDVRVVALSQQSAAIAAERRAMEPVVRAILTAQLSEELWREGFNRQLVELDLGLRPLRLAVDVTPGVWFEVTTPPQVLIVAPRDDIRVIESRLISPELGLPEIEELEGRVDGLGVSSIVTPIGGLAVYPSMIPNTMDLRATLVAIAHEWVHHYFFVRPLGLRYFADYRLRSINETAADIAGRELGEKVYRRYYADDPAPAAPRESPPQRTRENRPDFGTLMRNVRRRVEELLAAGQVEDAERFMVEQQRVFVEHGYYVRKINTAYLALFGSYVGGGNPDEPALRQLRDRAGSLKAFLDLVSSVDAPAAFDRIASAHDGA